MEADRRLCDLFGIEAPIIQAPMAGAMDAALVIAAAEGGALGSLPCGMLSADKARAEVARVRDRARRPLNLNFFCHVMPAPDRARDEAWRARLRPYYDELGIDPRAPVAAPSRAPFDAAACALVEELAPEVVSFHFGLPEAPLLARVKASGAKVIASATTVREAVWLEARGVDAVIAQGAEAGGHRGMFLTGDTLAQPGTFALVPQVVDAVRIPVIAAGGVADGRGIAAAFALGAAGVQIGTAYLRCAESTIAAPYRAALETATDEDTVLTNVMSGGPARGVWNRALRELGPMAGDAPAYPGAAAALAPLRAAAERAGSGDFTALWAGQAVALRRSLATAPKTGAAELTRALASDARERLARLRG